MGPVKSALILVAVLAVAGGALWVLSGQSDVSMPVAVMTGDRAYLKKATLVFLEDIKFKDFDKASTYHLEETQKARDIPALLQSVFRIKHEVLDIQSYEVLQVELDSTKARGRVRALVRYHVLGDRRVREDPDAFRDVEMLFYWFRQPDGTWVMELESSLK